MTACAPPDAGQLVAERLANYLDCQSQSLAANGFANLAGGWLGAALLAGCLTIFVALIGYRLLLGSPFQAREAVLTAIRAGIVLAFATSWSAYQTVIYRVAADGPAELASQLLSSDLAPPTLTDAARRLDAAYADLQAARANQLAAAPAPPALNASASANLTAAPVVAAASDARSDPAGSRTWFLLVVVVVGSLGALKLASGLLLGVGPLFITLGLFDATLGVLQGWGRALLGLFVATTGGVCLMAIQLAFIETQLPRSAASQQSVLDDPTLMAAAILFALAMAVVLVVGFAVGCSFRFPARLIGRDSQPANAAPARRPELAPALVTGRAVQPVDRAQSVADAVRRLGRRERAMDAPLATGPAARSFRAVGGGLMTSPSTGSRVARPDTRVHRTMARARTPSVRRRDEL